MADVQDERRALDLQETLYERVKRFRQRIFGDQLERTLAKMPDPLERRVYEFTVRYIAACQRQDFEGAVDLMNAHLAALREPSGYRAGAEAMRAACIGLVEADAATNREMEADYLSPDPDSAETQTSLHFAHCAAAAEMLVDRIRALTPEAGQAEGGEHA